MMDPCRPVNSIQDFGMYPYNDPITRFFVSRAVVSTYLSSYALEMNYQWFQENGVKVGDVVGWEEGPGDGWVMLTVDVSCAYPSDQRPVLLVQADKTAQSLWLAHDTNGRDIAFLDEEYRVVKLASLQGGQKYPPHKRPIVYSDEPIKYTLIALPGWLSLHGIRLKDQLIIQD